MRLELGSRRPLHVRREEIRCDVVRPVRLVYASDLHLTARRRHLVEGLRTRVVEAAPDAVLLGGDLVDRRNGLAALATAIESLTPTTRVLVVPGNHDAWVGSAAVRDLVLRTGGHWLPDGAVDLPGLRICGALHQRDARGAVHLLCGHDPAVLPRAQAAGFDVVLAGHLHGGQVVLWQRRGRMFPGALVYRYNGLRFEGEGTTMLVSRGMADTLPIRFNCPREVLDVGLVPDATRL